MRAVNKRLLRRVLCGVGGATIVLVVVGASSGWGALVSAAAAFFALCVSLVAVVQNFDLWRSAHIGDPLRRERVAIGASIANSLLIAIVYGWGALAMVTTYVRPLTGLWWQHGWQYGLAMALLGVASIGFARAGRRLVFGRQPEAPRGYLTLAALLAVVQGLVAIGGLAFLAISGKLAAHKADWAANRIFATLAVAVLAISIAALVTSARAGNPR